MRRSDISRKGYSQSGKAGDVDRCPFSVVRSEYCGQRTTENGERIMGFSTECIHAGQEPEPVTGAVIYPIFATSTYVQPRLGEHKGFEYARTKNPTRSVLEANLAALERGKYAHCFASGMAAIDTVFRLLQSGDHVIAAENMYGGSYRLF